MSTIAETVYALGSYFWGDTKLSGPEWRHFILAAEDPLYYEEKAGLEGQQFSKANSFDNTNQKRHPCRYGIRAWGDAFTERPLYVADMGSSSENDKKCKEATQAFLKTVVGMAPFHSNEKSSVPYGYTTYVYTGTGVPPKTVEELTGKEPTLRPCGFGNEQFGQGYLESTSIEPPCAALRQFTDAIGKTVWASSDLRSERVTRESKTNSFVASMFKCGE